MKANQVISSVPEASSQASEKGIVEARPPQARVPRMLILDDDPIVATVVRQHLTQRYPQAAIDVCREAKALPGYDVYFIDNDFEGQALALPLLEAIRQVAPQALIVALSNTLDFEVMLKMVNAGCNAVYNKRDLEASAEAREVIGAYLSIVAQQSQRKGSGKVLQILGSMRELIETWNRRLAHAGVNPHTAGN